MKKIVLSLVACLTLCFAHAQSTIEAEKLEQVIANPQAQIIDVRTPEEFQAGHIPGAENIDWKAPDSFEESIEHIDKSQPVYVYCLSGGRSAQASQYLADRGFHVINYSGGMLDWRAHNGPEISSSTEKKTPGMSSDAFQKEIGSHRLVLVNFSASWCPPCIKLKPQLEAFQKQQPDIKVLRLDADQNSELTQSMEITQLPDLKLYQDGALKWSHQGFISEQELTKAIHKFIQ